MGLQQHELPKPSATLNKLLAVTHNKKNDTVEGPMVRFVGDEVFITKKAFEAIPTDEPRDPAPRDVYLTQGTRKLRLANGEEIPNKFYGQVVLVKFFARSTGAPIHTMRDDNGDIVASERKKEFEVYPQQFKVHEVDGDRA